MKTLWRLLLWLAVTALVAAFVVTLGRVALRPALESAPVHAAGEAGLPELLFYALATLTVGGAAVVAFVRNILYSAVGLLAALLGAGALYVLLSADFVAITQLLVYVGGVLVLILFAVMLTNRITDVNVSNRSVGLWGGLLLLAAMAPVLVAVAVATPWPAREPGPLAPTTAAIGDALLTQWLLPFEVASLVLLATLVGAVVIARKELKEGDAAPGPSTPSGPAAPLSPPRPDAAP
jgi:NAD(P)H-quinone oxidoreductase subunit 6